MVGIKSDPPEDVFHIVYTGLLTHQQSYPSIIKALQNLEGNYLIRFSLAGNIPKQIIDEIRAALPKVELIYHGYLNHKEAIILMKRAHLLLNFIFEGANTQMISGKLLEYIASQRPILSLGATNSEAAKLIEKGSCAIMLNSNDLEGITSFINRIIEQKETLFNGFPEIEKWSRESLTKDLIKKCLD